jgi:hypothetical protein
MERGGRRGRKREDFEAMRAARGETRGHKGRAEIPREREGQAREKSRWERKL